MGRTSLWPAAAVLLFGAAGADGPRVFLLDTQRLGEARERVRSGDAQIAAAWTALKREAETALSAGPFSVVHKAIAPPSGDKHDYLSQAPYWWPNPQTAGGLPYVRRDGERNAEIERITDHREMDQMVGAVERLALAAYLGGDEKYAVKAAQLLRAWFIDPETRMHPHLQYGQFIPGVNTGRGIGLIETRGLTRAVDAVGLLEQTGAWSAADGRALREWFGRFLDWMRESGHGRDEAAAGNNHGTYYDVQVASFALFVGRAGVARDILEGARAKRIAAQVEPDGRQPRELARTRSWSYSVMNVDGLTQLAVLGDRAGVDLWGYRTPDSRSIRAALLYLAPYALGEGKWPHPQISEWTPQALFPVLRRAALHYRDAEFARIMSNVPAPAADDRTRLTWFR
jgi:hypothetical protein